MRTFRLKIPKGPAYASGPFEFLREWFGRLPGEHGRCCLVDETTGLYNRRFLSQELDRELERARRYRYEIAGLMIDIDDYKRVNDTYGHLMGDRVLREVACLLMLSKRKGDIVGRFGGDEFFVILPHATAGEAQQAARRFWANIREHPFKVGRDTFFITVSIGVSSMQEIGEINRFTAVEKADRAMFAAKRTGKDAILTV